MTPTDSIYKQIIAKIASSEELIPSRNGTTLRCFDLPTISFEATPLVTIRKTAWHKAIREMEWFLSGSIHCPKELLDWWEPQLSRYNTYNRGYGEQLRYYGRNDFDQIANLIAGIRSHPYSRRHLITTWDSEDMSMITQLNSASTPTTCHTTIAQFFVSRDHFLSFHSYQRSADMLLGVPHNWIQSWALLLWVAAQTDKIPDKMLWTFGDAHLYQEESHLQTIDQILATKELTSPEPFPRLIYNGKEGDEFKASDFEMIGKIPAPLVTSQPKLL